MITLKSQSQEAVRGTAMSKSAVQLQGVNGKEQIILRKSALGQDAEFHRKYNSNHRCGGSMRWFCRRLAEIPGIGPVGASLQDLFSSISDRVEAGMPPHGSLGLCKERDQSLWR
jgi:hypothetical protein